MYEGIHYDGEWHHIRQRGSYVDYDAWAALTTCGLSAVGAIVDDIDTLGELPNGMSSTICWHCVEIDALLLGEARSALR